MESIITLLIVLAIALTLYFTLTWLAKKLMPDNGNQNRKITTFGVIFYLVFTGLLLAVFSLQYLAPDITTTQRLLLAAAITTIAVVLENILKKYGIKTAHNINDKSV